MSTADLSGLSMFELFRMEAESQTQILTSGLLTLERGAAASDVLESCMRAAHSLKGAARIVGLHSAERVTHAMEDCFVAAQKGQLTLHEVHVDVLLRGVDLITRIAGADAKSAERWLSSEGPEVDAFVAALAQARAEEPSPSALEPPPPDSAAIPPTGRDDLEGRFIRVTSSNFDRLLGLAGESLVEARWLQPFSSSLLRLKRMQHDAVKALDTLRDRLSLGELDELAQRALLDVRSKTLACQHYLSGRQLELELFDRRTLSVSQRLYDEALKCRMRPLSDGVQAFPRMVRDLARTLGKEARLEVVGEATQVDRDVLEKLEGQLIHMLRNAVDHGIDAPEQRRARGKPAEGLVRLEARHVGGMLQITVSDDGEGIDKHRLRAAIVARGLLDGDMAERLSDSELYDFLFLPGFTLKHDVTAISGRGVGLDAVHEMVRTLRGSIRVSSQPGRGVSFQLLLPLTLSLMRTLLVQIGGEPYAFPLANIERALTVARGELSALEGRQHFRYQGRAIGLVPAHQLLDCAEPPASSAALSVIVLAHQDAAYGLVVERFLGVRELVVQGLDPRLGKIKDITAGALLEDGSPVLIVDTKDLTLSIEKLIAVGHLGTIHEQATVGRSVRRKRVLVVDDSLTVRELQRKLLDSGGYEVEVAVDGVDGWNALRAGEFNLVVTDVDMPRMDGVELVRHIRKDSKLHSLPVMIVSYKDREEDRRRGLEAGADYYLAKSSFQSESLLHAVVDLIGDP